MDDAGMVVLGKNRPNKSDGFKGAKNVRMLKN